MIGYDASPTNAAYGIYTITYPTSGWTNQTHWIDNSGWGSAVPSELERALALEQALKVRRRTGRDYRAFLSTVERLDRALEKMKRAMDNDMVAYRVRAEAARSARLSPRRREPGPPRPVIRRARACSASSSRSSLPPHAHCPR